MPRTWRRLPDFTRKCWGSKSSRAASSWFLSGAVHRFFFSLIPGKARRPGGTCLRTEQRDPGTCAFGASWRRDPDDGRKNWRRRACRSRRKWSGNREAVRSTSATRPGTASSLRRPAFGAAAGIFDDWSPAPVRRQKFRGAAFARPAGAAIQVRPARPSDQRNARPPLSVRASDPSRARARTRCDAAGCAIP